MADAQDAGAARQSLKFDFQGLDDYIAMAEVTSEDGHFDEAISIMREAAARWPDNARAHFHLATVIFLKLKADRTHLELWEDLADEEELAEECFDALQEAIRLDAAMAAAHKNLGTLLAVRGRTEKAVAEWEKALELDPNQPELKSDLEALRARLSRG